MANPSKSPDDDEEEEEEEDNTHTRRLSKKKKKHTTTKRPPSPPPPPLPPPRRLFPGVVVMVGRTPKERVSFLLYTKKWLSVFPVQLKKVKERDDICLGSRGWLKKKRGGGGVSKKRKVENPIIEQKKKRVTFHARTRKNNNSKTNVCLIVDCCDSRGASFDSSFARCRRSISILRVASRGPRGGFECLSLSLHIYFFWAREKIRCAPSLSCLCDWILSAILDSCARVRALDLSDLSIRLFLRLSLSVTRAHA